MYIDYQNVPHMHSASAVVVNKTLQLMSCDLAYTLAVLGHFHIWKFKYLSLQWHNKIETVTIIRWCTFLIEIQGEKLSLGSPYSKIYI